MWQGSRTLQLRLTSTGLAGWHTTCEARGAEAPSCRKAAVQSACFKQAAMALPDTTMVSGTAAQRRSVSAQNASSQVSSGSSELLGLQNCKPHARECWVLKGLSILARASPDASPHKASSGCQKTPSWGAKQTAACEGDFPKPSSNGCSPKSWQPRSQKKHSNGQYFQMLNTFPSF